MPKLLSVSGFHPSLTACAIGGSTDVQLFSAGSAAPSAPPTPSLGSGHVSAVALAYLAASPPPTSATPDASSSLETRTRKEARGAAVRVHRVPPGATDEVGADAGADGDVSSYLSDLDLDRIPAHVAIVMDGNGRWAQQRGLSRTEGHAAGEDALWDTIQGAVQVGVKWLTVFAFSTENWRRPPTEVRYLMNFNRDSSGAADVLHEMNVRIRFLGRRNWRVPWSVLKEIDRAEAMTAGNTGTTLSIAFNYGGRARSWTP